ncbi:MAG: preprotein translocase subunit SecA [Dehalococcoidia bacterium]|nr:preprotein translocase subunit SecA [Dehalococcoidia bacterium]
MFKWLNKLVDSNEREINRLRPVVAEINALEPRVQAMTDDELRALVARSRVQVEGGETDLERLLPEVFATVREAARRTIGQRHYDVQLMGGMALHHGKIAEMKTGEGKTLVATLPVSLNAVSGDGVHVITVNDYLAKRDAQWMGPVYHLLGFSVASIQHEAAFMYDPGYSVEDPRYNHLRPISRREAYDADITYGTNNEFGFDYLRDNMAVDLSQCVQRELNYAIVDEVDNILIDEARTPLIISGQAEESTDQYQTLSRLAPMLKAEADYRVDEKARSVSLTEAGVHKMENWLHIENLYDPEHYQITHYVESALKAHVLFKRDKDYIVKDGQVIIVDEFTGRQMPGRRWSDGLHQAVEAKEGVQVQRESLTLATITFQNYFRLYDTLAGMTGTALTEAEEFHKIYKLEVVVVPTNRPAGRQDGSDLVYKTQKAKYEAVVEEIVEMYQEKRPVLVGTVTIENSEYLSELLSRQGVEHQVLNAKFHEYEAAIVAQAGRVGAVTIATNMAGRGTDILLGGNPDGMALQEAMSRGIEPDSDPDPDAYAAILADTRARCAEEHEQVVQLGGLHIIGTERHEARRIDNQLRGRAGRQGDPGSSRFYISLEDDIMRRFGGDRIKSLMDRFGLEDDVPIEHGMVSKSIENAQTKVEGHNFDIRKHLVDYDDVMNTQRETIYGERQKVLLGADLRANVFGMVTDEIKRLLNEHLQGNDSDDWNAEGLFAGLGAVMPPVADLTEEGVRLMTREELEELLLDHAERLYDAKELETGADGMRLLERLVVLRTIDALWVEHLTAMDQMRQGIGLRAIGQSDPLVAYKREAFEMFNELRGTIQSNIALTIFRVSLVQEPVAPPAPVQVTANRNAAPATFPTPPLAPPPPLAPAMARSAAPMPLAPSNHKPGRNDLCYCGSGKKFKRCHGA